MTTREWATPLTMGAFLVMAVTGLLMFFHLESGFNKPLHEWFGWAMAIGAAGHVVANWFAVKRYLTANRNARLLVGACAAALLLSFAPRPGDAVSPPVQAMQGVLRAPLPAVASLVGRPVDALRADLAAAGVSIAAADASVTLESATHGDRDLQRKAIRAIFDPTH